MSVEELMTKPVYSCRREDSLEHAARVLWDHDCGSLPVVGEHGQLHGMITDRDICMAAYTSGRRLAELEVREAMSIDPATLRMGDSPRAAELMMRERAVRRLPVVGDHGRVVGILTCNDLVRRVDVAIAAGDAGHDAVHLVTTLAIVGRPRHASAGDGAPTASPAATADAPPYPVRMSTDRPGRRAFRTLPGQTSQAGAPKGVVAASTNESPSREA